MSASFDKKTGHVYVLEGANTKEIETFFSMIFDESVMYDEQEIILEMEETKLLKRVCLIKTLLFPLELFLTLLFLPKEWLKERMEQQRVYWKMFRGKINIREFQETLMDISDLYLQKKDQK